MKHIAVLKKEVVDLMNIKSDGTYLDVTFGSGGHSQEILDKLDGGLLLAVDYSEDSVNSARDLNQKDGFKLFKANFKDIKSVLSGEGISQVDGILADLGWSTDQLESIEGLSFMKDEAVLDMRLDDTLGLQAKDLLNALGPRELEKMFLNYSGLSKRKSRQLSENIVSRRKINKFEKVSDLKEVVISTFRADDYSIYSKVFQALRIAVNDEFTNLKVLIKDSIDLLKQGGRLLIITFHSGEEDIVSFLFNKFENKKIIKFVLEDKFVRPGVEELKENINSRSAKLWVIEKL